jgi:tetratricopeptide (TPR) repeat protein
MSVGGGAIWGANDSWIALHNQGVAAAQRQDFQAASELFRNSWDVAGSTFEQGISANDLGVALVRLNRGKEGLPWLERALAIWKNEPDESRYAAGTTQAIATVMRQLGDYPPAERLLRQALTAKPLDNEDRARMLNLLADILREEGKPSESRAVFSETLRIPGISWGRLADSTTGLADLDRSAQSWESSFAEWNSAAEMARQHQAPDIEAVAMRGLGETWLDKGEVARAEPLLRRALAIFQSDPLSRAEMPTTMGFMGQLYLAEDKPAMAQDTLTQAVDLEERLLGDNHPQVAVLLQILADAAARRTKIDLARDYFERALRIMAGAFGENSAPTGVVLANWATAEQRAGDIGRALAQFQKSLEILRMAGREAAAVRMTTLERYARLLKATHRGKEASALFAEVKSLRDVR